MFLQRMRNHRLFYTLLALLVISTLSISAACANNNSQGNDVTLAASVNAAAEVPQTEIEKVTAVVESSDDNDSVDAPVAQVESDGDQPTLPQQSYLPLDLAMTAATAALENCAAEGYGVSVTVVDAGGVQKTHLRAMEPALTQSVAVREKHTRLPA